MKTTKELIDETGENAFKDGESIGIILGGLISCVMILILSM